jgi:trigger factor
MSKGREEIPSSVKREVRRRCGFGCVVCGRPLYDYHHIVPYAISPVHDPDNITLLCGLHHPEATHGLLPTNKIVEANQKPFNKLRNVSTPYGLHFKTPIEIVIGGNSLATVVARDEPRAVAAIRIDDIDIIGFQVSESGELFLSAQLFTLDGFPLVYIHENEIIYSVEKAWDVEFKGKTLTIREGKSKVLLKLRFDPPHRLSIIQGVIAYMGAIIFVFPKGIAVANPFQIFRRFKTRDHEVGLLVGDENKMKGNAGIVIYIEKDQRRLATLEAQHLRRKAQKLIR